LRRFLDSPRTRASALVNGLDDVVNRLLPKSIVVYARKPGVSPRKEPRRAVAAVAPPPRTFAEEAHDIARQDPETQTRRALETLRSARFSFVSAVESLTEEEASAPGPNGKSLKEIVAHMAAWDEWTAAGLREIAHGAMSPSILRLEGHPDGPFASVDEFNAASFAWGREQTWASVLDRSRKAFESLIEAAESLTGADLARTVPYEWRALQLTLPAGLYLLLEDARHYAEEHASDVPAPVTSPATRVP
jgi:hypothetical protein